MQAGSLPIDIVSWGLAVLPIVVLLVLLVGLRWQAHEAGPVGMFTAAVIALLAFQIPWEGVAIAGGKGIWDAIFILFVVWPALLLYHVIKRGGGFVALQDGIERYSDNELFLVLAFAWVFPSFLQGIAGFGTPIAVCAPLLLAIGVKPVYSVALPLIGHAWANMFGTLAVAWLATIQIIDLGDLTETAFQTGILLWIPALLAGIAIAWLYGRTPAVRRAAPMIVIVSLIHGGFQLGLVPFTPILSTFLAATVAMLALYPLSRWERYDRPVEGIENRPVMTDGGRDQGGDESDEGRDEPEEGETGSENRDEPGEEGATDEDDTSDDEAGEDDEPESVMSFGMSLLPYAVLTVVAIAVLVPTPVEEFFDQFTVGLSFPGVETGYGLETPPEEPYSPFSPLTHPGSFLLVSVLAAWVVYRVRGYYEQWDDRSEGEEESIWGGLAEDAMPASIAIVAFLVMAQLMQHAGQIDVLALGIAVVAPPAVYAFFSSWIGGLGAFMTSSNTSSNIIFSPLQQQAVEAMEGLSEATIIGGQSAGGAVGNAIAPANVVLGTGTVGAVGEEGSVLRITLPWVLLVLVLVGGLTVALNGLVLLGGG